MTLYFQGWWNSIVLHVSIVHSAVDGCLGWFSIGVGWREAKPWISLANQPSQSQEFQVKRLLPNINIEADGDYPPNFNLQPGSIYTHVPTHTDKHHTQTPCSHSYTLMHKCTRRQKFIFKRKTAGNHMGKRGWGPQGDTVDDNYAEGWPTRRATVWWTVNSQTVYGPIDYRCDWFCL